MRASRIALIVAIGALLAGSPPARTSAAQSAAAANAFNDSHFHLTNYIQQGITVPQFLEIMGSREIDIAGWLVRRSAHADEG